MRLQDKIELTGALHFNVLRAGKVVDTYDNHNMIMTAARQMLAQIVTGEIVDTIYYIGIGEGTAAESSDDTTLENVCKVPLTGRSVDGTQAKFEFTIGKNAGNGLNVREFGLFTERGTMFSHKVRDSSAQTLIKDSDITIEGYWVINF